MKFQNRFNRSAICLAQSLLLLIGNGTLAYAITGSSNSSLDSFEKSVFGETHNMLSESVRLKDLEMNLFGKARTGTDADRISGISKALGGSKNNNLLMPALAPQLDTSSEHSLQSAPSNNHDSSSVPAITASGDAEKETLRNAMNLYSQGRTDDAEKQFRKALSINKNSADAYYNLGVIAEGKGDFSGALNSYRSAARINPSDTDLANAISGVENKLQDKTNAAQHQVQAQQQAALEQQEQRKNDNLKQMIGTAATAYKSGDYDKAISNLQYVSQQAPNDADVLYALGQAYKAKGDFSKARGIFNSAIGIEPNNPLYKNALTDLNRVANNGGSSSSSYSPNSSGNDGMPAPAPSRRHNKAGQLTGFSGDASANNSYGSSGSGSSDGGSGTGSGAGQLTPFSGIANGSTSGPGDDEYSNNTRGGSPYSGYASSSGSGRRSMLGGLGGLGSLGGLGVGLLGAGGMGSMLGGGVRYNGGYNGSYMNRGYGGGSSTRIKRVAIGGLTGAAAGALYGGIGHGNVKSTAMKGALMGAAMGLFMGGF
jgi:tetratricopeptide (TPR) repeat protein